MNLSKKMKFSLIMLFIILNIILRFQVISHEIGADSFEMHVMANSLSEFGYAKWILHPLSFAGLYPASYTSTVQFVISAISQSADIEMESTIFLYCIFIGILSMFTAYLMAGEIIDNDLFKLFTAVCFSVSPAILGYTTWTMPSRGILIILAPLLIYLVLKCRKSIKYVLLTFLLAMFLFVTHHLFFYLIPAFVAFFILFIFFKLRKHIDLIKIPEKFNPIFIIIGFFLMFSIPFFTGRFLELSRYSLVDISYFRYLGILIIPSVGGLSYLILKHNKNFGDWFLLLTLMFLTTFVYQQTYMKWFLPIFIAPLASIGLMNIIRLSEKQKLRRFIFVIYLVLFISFSGYFQFLNYLQDSEINKLNERYIEESTYNAGHWMNDNVNGLSISNDVQFGQRIFASSYTAHLLTDSSILNQIYGFMSVNISEFKRYPITSEDFWFSGYQGPDLGQVPWEAVHMLWKSPNDFNLTYFVENTKANGNIIWNHGWVPSKLLHETYEKDFLVYDDGKTRLWKLK